MEFLITIVFNQVLPVLVILASFVLVFFYGFKSQEIHPDFTGFSQDDEELKPKTKKVKTKKTGKPAGQNSSPKQPQAPQKPQKAVVAQPMKEVVEPEITKKVKKTLQKGVKSEASSTTDEWIVKKDRKIKKKKEDDEVVVGKKQKAVETDKSMKVKVDGVKRDEKDVAVSDVDVVVEEGRSDVDGNVMKMVESKIKKKKVSESEKVIIEEVVAGEVEAAPAKPQPQSPINLELQRQVEEFQRKMKAFGMQNGEEVLLVVEDGSGKVAEAEKQIAEVEKAGKKEKKGAEKNEKKVEKGDEEVEKVGELPVKLVKSEVVEEVRVGEGVVDDETSKAKKKKQKKKKATEQEESEPQKSISMTTSIEITRKPTEPTAAKKAIGLKEKAPKASKLVASVPTPALPQAQPSQLPSHDISSEAKAPILAPSEAIHPPPSPTTPVQLNGIETTEDWTESKAIKKKKKKVAKAV